MMFGSGFEVSEFKIKTLYIHAEIQSSVTEMRAKNLFYCG